MGIRIPVPNFPKMIGQEAKILGQWLGVVEGDDGPVSLGGVPVQQLSAPGFGGTSAQLAARLLSEARVTGKGAFADRSIRGLAKEHQLLTGKDNIGPELLSKLEPYPGNLRVQPGKSYAVPRLPEHFIQADPAERARTIMVQDPNTGTIFATSGGGHHGDLVRWLRSKGVNIPEENYLSHEIFPPSGKHPGRANFNVWGAPWRESNYGSFARTREMKPSPYVENEATQRGKEGLLRILGYPKFATSSKKEPRWTYTVSELAQEEDPVGMILSKADQMDLLSKYTGWKNKKK